MNTEITSIDEANDLARLEAIVAKGLQTFLEVGAALTEIWDRKIYGAEHATFADYCKTKWGMTDRRARQLMGAAKVVAEISKSGTMVPKSERQARPLTQLEPGQRAAAWNEAAASSPTGTPTAKQVEVVVSKRAFRQPEEAKTPLQQITHLIEHLWPELNGSDRDRLCNCISGLWGGS